MKKKSKKQIIFPANKKTEFARFTDPEDFTFDPDIPRNNKPDASFFDEDLTQTDPENDYRL